MVSVRVDIPSHMAGPFQSTANITSAAQHLFLSPASVGGRDVTGRSAADQITQILIGPSCIRPRGWAPTLENIASITQVVARCIRSNLPIHCVAMGGAMKHYGRTEQVSPDLAELLWILRFEQLHQQVSRIHPPGLRIHMYLEDFARWYRTLPSNDRPHRCMQFIQQLRAMVACIAQGIITVEPESEVFAITPSLIAATHLSAAQRIISQG